MQSKRLTTFLANISQRITFEAECKHLVPKVKTVPGIGDCYIKSYLYLLSFYVNRKIKLMFDVQVRRADFNNDHYLQTFGINVSNQMTEVQGRVLSAPKIQYGGRVSLVSMSSQCIVRDSYVVFCPSRLSF